MTQKITAQLLKGGLTVNASGHISATKLVGALQGDVTGDLLGDVTGDVTGNASTATTADSADTLNQQTSINLSGTYSTHQLLVANAYALTGDVTVNDNLILGKLSDDGEDFVIEGNYTFTTTGAGKVEAGYISSSGLSNVDGMTGTLGSGVSGGSGLTALGTISSGTLGSGVTFPTGHIIQTEIDAYYQTGSHWYSGYAVESWSWIPSPLNATITRKHANSYFHVIAHYPNLYTSSSFALVSIFENGTQAIGPDQGMYVSSGIYGGNTGGQLQIISTTAGGVGETITFRMYVNPLSSSENVYFHVYSYGTLTIHEFLPTSTTIARVADKASLEGYGS